MILQELKQVFHRECVVCSERNKTGLHMDFQTNNEQAVSAGFMLDKSYEGYAGMVHGGIVSAIMDGAMTNCLFARDKVAFTADMHIRYRHPVLIDKPARVRAWITRFTPPIFVVQAEITQDGQVMSTATGKFMEKQSLKNLLEHSENE